MANRPSPNRISVPIPSATGKAKYCPPECPEVNPAVDAFSVKTVADGCCAIAVRTCTCEMVDGKPETTVEWTIDGAVVTEDDFNICEDGECAQVIAKIAGGGLTIDGEVEVNLDALIEALTGEDGSAIEKLCAILEALDGEEGSAIEKLCAMLVELETANTISAAEHLAIMDCLAQIKTNTAAITGIETSFGQLGCIKDADGNQTGTVLVCKISPEDGSPATTVVHAYYTDGTVDTAYTGPWEVCGPEAGKPFPCEFGIRVDVNTVDNHSIGEPRPVGPGIVAWPTDDHELTLTLSDGTTCSAPWPKWDGVGSRWRWTNEQLAIAIAACTGKPWVFGVSGPDGDTNSAWGGHATVECCPGDVHVVAATAVVVGGKREGRTIPLAVNMVEGDWVKYTKWVCLGEPTVWTDADGAVIEAPDSACMFKDCVVPPADPCGCPVPVDCSVQTYGPLLDCILATSDEEQDQTVATDIYLDMETCDGATTAITYTLEADDDGNLAPIPYDVVGQLANPDKSLLVLDPPPCPDADNWNLVRIQMQEVIIDNSNWVNAPGPHIGAGVHAAASYEVDITMSDGSVKRFSHPAGAVGWANQFYRQLWLWLQAEFPDCTVDQVCANWANCRPGEAPNWGEPDAACLFARGLRLICCASSVVPVSGEVVGSSNPDWIGATHDFCSFVGPVESYYQTHIGCNIVTKDCNGTVVVIPPCKPVIDNPLLEFKTTCGGDAIPDANYDGAIAITSGRPLPTIPWALIDNRDPNNQVTVASGATFQEFSAALADLGYSQFIEGEIHHICPCPPGLVNAGDYFVEADGDTVTKPACTPLTELSNAPDKPAPDEGDCALRVKVCNLDELEIDSGDIEECCTGGATEATRACYNFPSADLSSDNPDCVVTIVGVTMPNPYTAADVQAALPEGATISEDVDANGRVKICTDGSVAMCVTKRCGKTLSRYCIAGAVNTAEEVCTDFQRTWDKWSEPTAGILETSLAVQEEMLAKQCAALTDCEACSTITLPVGAVVASFDQTGLEVPIEPPANGIAELITALTNQGYSVDSQTANSVTVCGTKLIGAIRLEGGELVLSTPAPAKQGQLVCDPSTRALLDVMGDIKSLLQTNNSLLGDLSKCLCGPKDVDACDVPFTVNNGANTGEFVPFGDAGPDANWPAPVPNDNAIFGGVGFNLQAAYPECAEGSVRVKLAFDHETSGGVYNSGTGGHNGFFMSVPVGSGTFVAGSGTNGLTVTNATSIKLANPAASPWGTERSVRCVEMDIPIASLAAGIPFNFAAFGSVGVGGEMLHSIETSIVSSAELDCSACEPAGEGGGPLGSAFAIACDNNALLTTIAEKMCEPCPLVFENIVAPDASNVVTQVVPGDQSVLNGTQQDVMDPNGNVIGQVNVTATYNATANQTTIVMTPVVATQTMTSIKSLSTRARVAKKVAVISEERT